jgi:hypothetical protein
MGAKRNAYRILIGKYEYERPVGSSTYRCENDAKMDLRETGRGGLEGVLLTRALVNTVMSLRVH